MLMNEFELVYWYHVLERYLRLFSSDPKAVRRISAKGVRVLFFFAAMFVKKFLAKNQEQINMDVFHIRQG